MAVMDEFCMKQVDNEISIINENISKSDFVYQDSFGDVEFLGFAHSHPQETELRYSIYDTENHKYFAERFGDFLSIIINPQNNEMLCFAGKDIKQATLTLYAIGRQFCMK